MSQCKEPKQNDSIKRQLSEDDDFKLTTVNLNNLNNETTLDSINDSNYLNTTPLNNTSSNIIKNESFQPKKLENDSCSKKKKVEFKDVNLYLFDRTQGFQSIPSDTYETSITLGMEFKHSCIEKFDSLDEYFKFKRTIHLSKLEKELNSVTNENNEDLDYINKINEILKKKNIYESDHHLDLPISSDVFCPILSPNERMSKLAEFGFSADNLDLTETNEISDIKQARAVNIGCKCKEMNMVCGENGDLCSCTSNGIQCQLDKTRYPCECTLKKCKNPNGVKRFDQKTVIKHRMAILSNQNNEVNNKEQQIMSGASIVATPEIKRKHRKRNSGSYPDYSKRRKKSNIKNSNSPSINKNNQKLIIVGDNITITTSSVENDLGKSNQTDTIKQIDVNIMKN